MKNIAIVLVGVLFFTPLFIGTGIAGEPEWQSEDNMIYGRIEKIPASSIGIWVIEGRRVIVTMYTIIEEEHGQATVGADVEVEGSSPGKTFTANKITVAEKRK
jgi:hypothetical protein